MKRDINIKITVTDEPIDVSSIQKTGPDRWHITISPKDAQMPGKFEGKNGVGLAILAHELGHALGQSLLGELQTSDDYFAKGFFGIITPNTLKEEKRAWAVGEEVFDQVKDFALETYASQVNESF